MELRTYFDALSAVRACCVLLMGSYWRLSCAAELLRNGLISDYWLDRHWVFHRVSSTAGMEMSASCQFALLDFRCTSTYVRTSIL